MNLQYESKITSLLEYLKIFEESKNKTKTELEKRFGIPMVLFQIINYTIDLADIIISIKKLGYPAKYSDNFEILYTKEIISKELKDNLQTLCQYRNIIAHEYHTLNKEDLEEIQTLLPSITDFILIVEQTLQLEK